MNHSIRITLLLFLTAATLGAQDSNRWTLFQSLDWPARLSYLQDQASVKEDGPFLLQALELVDAAQVETGTDQEVAVKKDVTLLLVKALAAHPAPGAIVAIGLLPHEYQDPILRGESWLALAKLGDKRFVPGLILTLTTLNQSGTRSRSEEIQASYAVQAFEVLKTPEAFRAVAGASVAWYAPVSGVKTLAKKLLPLLTADFEKAALPLLSDEEDLDFREAFFEDIVASGDSARSARAASAVLSTLVNQRPAEKAEQDTVRRLTLSALVTALRAPQPPASLVPSLKVLLGRTEAYEILSGSVRLLGRINDPSAVALLSDTLTGFNVRQKAGTNTNQDLSLVKELFQALAQTGKASARTALDEARFSDYSPGFVRDAQASEDKLPRE